MILFGGQTQISFHELMSKYIPDVSFRNAGVHSLQWKKGNTDIFFMACNKCPPSVQITADGGQEVIYDTCSVT